MEKLQPYKNIDDAIQSLDNGGRFFNILTKAKDGVINQAELGKVAGLFSDQQQMILFLELSMLQLSSKEKEAIVSKLDSELQKNYKAHQPKELLPSEANLKGTIASNAIITGIPKLVDAKSDFHGFIMVPIMTGNVTTFTMIPLIDEYDVYELRDEESSETFFIAHQKRAEKLPVRKMILGGVLKEIKEKETEDGITGKFLEVVYSVES